MIVIAGASEGQDSRSWRVGLQTLVLQTITLPSPEENPEEDAAISCLLHPSLIPLLPKPLPPALPRVAINPNYAVLQTPSKGFGMFATRDIEAGELIVMEHPVLILPCIPPGSLPEEAYDALGECLPPRRKADLFGMSNSQDPEDCPNVVEGIVRTNALIIRLRLPSIKKGKGNEADAEIAKTPYGGVYPLINRANHSCGPNAAVTWHNDTLAGCIYALRPIKVGEEILKTYVDPTLPRSTRMDLLQLNHHFKCDCPWCDVRVIPPSTTDGTLDDAARLNAVERSDANRAEIVEWFFTRPGYKKWSTDLCQGDELVIKSHLVALEIIEQEGLQGFQILFVEEIALCYAMLGDEEEFRCWGGKVVQLSKIEDRVLAEKFEGWLIDPPKRFKRWAWRAKQRKQLSRKRTRQLDSPERFFGSLGEDSSSF